jgi:hypothetical protein
MFQRNILRLSTRQLSFTIQKTIINIFTAMRTSNLNKCNMLKYMMHLHIFRGDDGMANTKTKIVTFCAIIFVARWWECATSRTYLTLYIFYKGAGHLLDGLFSNNTQLLLNLWCDANILDQDIVHCTLFETTAVFLPQIFPTIGKLFDAVYFPTLKPSVLCPLWPITVRVCMSWPSTVLLC